MRWMASLSSLVKSYLPETLVCLAHGDVQVRAQEGLATTVKQGRTPARLTGTALSFSRGHMLRE